MWLKISSHKNHYQFIHKSKLSFLFHDYFMARGVWKVLMLSCPLWTSSASLGLGARKSKPDELQEVAEMRSCKEVVINTVWWSAAGETLGWGSQVWHLSVLKKLLWRRLLSFPKSFTLADAINTPLAGYPRISWEESDQRCCSSRLVMGRRNSDKRASGHLVQISGQGKCIQKQG